VVSGIAVAIAGAIALQTLFSGVENDFTRSTHADLRRAQIVVEDYGAPLGSLAHRLGGARGIRSATGISPNGRGTRTTCTALYGCMSRHRSIIRWKRLSRPGTFWSAAFNRPTLSAPVSRG